VTAKHRGIAVHDPSRHIAVQDALRQKIPR